MEGNNKKNSHRVHPINKVNHRQGGNSCARSNLLWKEGNQHAVGKALMPSLIQSTILFFFNNRGTGTFYGLALRTLHGDPNFRVLTTPQQPTPSKFKVSSMVRFELKTIYHLLGLHFSVFALTNWATTLVGPNKIHNY